MLVSTHPSCTLLRLARRTVGIVVLLRGTECKGCKRCHCWEERGALRTSKAPCKPLGCPSYCCRPLEDGIHVLFLFYAWGRSPGEHTSKRPDHGQRMASRSSTTGLLHSAQEWIIYTVTRAVMAHGSVSSRFSGCKALPEKYCCSLLNCGRLSPSRERESMRRTCAPTVRWDEGGGQAISGQ